MTELLCISAREAYHSLCTPFCEKKKLVERIEVSCQMRFVNLPCLGVAKGQKNGTEGRGKEYYVGIKQFYGFVQTEDCSKHRTQTTKKS